MRKKRSEGEIDVKFDSDDGVDNDCVDKETDDNGQEDERSGTADK